MAVAQQKPINRIVALFLAFELSSKYWKLGFSTGFGQRPRERTISAGDLEALQREIRLAKQRFGLAEDTAVMSCYEIGRDGFWLHRYLRSAGVENLVVSSSSIEVPRKGRRRKTDRLDVEKLLTMLMRHYLGDKRVWSVVRVPSVEEEDRRQLHRELEALKKERTQHTNRIKSLLVCHGIRLAVGRLFLLQLENARQWDGSPLPPGLVARLKREYGRIQMANDQIRELEAQRREIIRHEESPAIAKVRQLMRLRAIGVSSAWLFNMELFAWRKFRNGKEIGGVSGLAPTPRQSGDEYVELGISKAGIRNVRWMAIEIAWGWLRYQPDSELSRWFMKRFGHGTKRMQRVGIVALARKLLIALWRYLETGTVPEGAVLKPRAF
jgi:transposase